jgi:CubicO group peptidase (beta-lactamase class C family)
MLNMVNLLLPLSVFLLPSALGLECRPKGVIFPRPRNLEQSETFQNALDTLTTTLNAAFNGDIRAGWDIRNVSLSMALVGFDQTESSTPVWEYHHLASGNVNGTKSLDKHSQYLIGSVSKVITDAILIRTGVNMDDPVIKYLPVLNNNTALIDWNNISLRALGGHLAGIAPNCKLLHLHGLKFQYSDLFQPGFLYDESTSPYPPRRRDCLHPLLSTDITDCLGILLPQNLV